MTPSDDAIYKLYGRVDGPRSQNETRTFLRTLYARRGAVPRILYTALSSIMTLMNWMNAIHTTYTMAAPDIYMAIYIYERPKLIGRIRAAGAASIAVQVIATRCLNYPEQWRPSHKHSEYAHGFTAQ